MASCLEMHKDFIEIEIPRQTTYDQLVTLMWNELGLSSNAIRKVRRLPNTEIRNDRDVHRLQNHQELELVLNHDFSWRILRIRVANCDEKDFTEIIATPGETFDELMKQMRFHLGLDTNTIVRKVRKLPNTIIRTHGDVQRLRNNDELELVLAQGPINPPVASTSGDTGYKAAVSPKQIDIVY